MTPEQEARLYQTLGWQNPAAVDRLTAAVERPPTIVESVYAVLCDLVDNGLDLNEPITAGALLADLLTSANVPPDQWPPEVVAYLDTTYRPAA